MLSGAGLQVAQRLPFVKMEWLGCVCVCVCKCDLTAIPSKRHLKQLAGGEGWVEQERPSVWMLANPEWQPGVSSVVVFTLFFLAIVPENKLLQKSSSCQAVCADSFFGEVCVSSLGERAGCQAVEWVSVALPPVYLLGDGELCLVATGTCHHPVLCCPFDPRTNPPLPLTLTTHSTYLVSSYLWLLPPSVMPCLFFCCGCTHKR